MLTFDTLSPELTRFWLPVTLFALVTSASPGPVNIVAAGSGVLFGLRRSLPQVVGASLGFALLMLMIGLGPGMVLARWGSFQTMLRWLGSVFLLYLAVQLHGASSTLATVSPTLTRPPRCTDGLLAQWMNPKAWIVAATGVTSYALPGADYTRSIVQMAALFFLVCLPSIGAWAGFGVAARHLLHSERALRRFNRVMAVALLLSVTTLWL
jgi:threonine/homoserine/homoserine lactone efflux protein